VCLALCNLAKDMIFNFDGFCEVGFFKNSLVKKAQL